MLKKQPLMQLPCKYQGSVSLRESCCNRGFLHLLSQTSSDQMLSFFFSNSFCIKQKTVAGYIPKKS